MSNFFPGSVERWKDLASCSYAQSTAKRLRRIAEHGLKHEGSIAHRTYAEIVDPRIDRGAHTRRIGIV